jgi:hypothetical protein
LAYIDSLSVGNRIWEANFTAPRQSLLAIWQPWSALSAGLSLTIIVLAYLLLAMQRETRTRLVVEQRTRELSKTNRQLGEEILDRSRVQLEMARLYEISSIFSVEGDFEAKATESLEKLAVLASSLGHPRITQGRRARSASGSGGRPGGGKIPADPGLHRGDDDEHRGLH